MDIKKLTLKIIFSYFFSTLNFILGYLIRIFATRTLNPQQLGLAYSIIYISSFLVNVLDFGIRNSFNYLFHERKNKKESLSIYLSINLMLLFFSLFILLIFKSFIMKILKIEESFFYLFVLLFLSVYIFSDLLNIIKVEIKPVLENFFYFLRFFLILLIFFIFVKVFNDNLDLLFLISWILPSVLVSLILLIYLIRNYGIIFLSFSKKYINEFYFLLKKGSLLFFLSISSYFMFYIDTLVVVYFLGHENYSYYNLAYSLLHFPIFLFTTLSSFLFPLTLKKKELVKKYYFKMLELLFFLIVPFSFLYFLYSKEIVLVIFGKNYLESHKVLSLFSLFLVFYLMKNYLVNILAGLKKLKYLLVLNLLVGLLNLILNLIAAIFFKSLTFIALATGISWFFFYLFLELKIKKEFQVEYKKITVYFFKVLIQSVLLALFVFFIKNNLDINIYLEFFLIGVISATFYLSISLLFKTIPSSLKELFDAFLLDFLKNKK